MKDEFQTLRLGVSSENLQVDGLLKPIDVYRTVWTASLEIFTTIKNLLKHQPTENVKIITGWDGLVESGRMLLVLGRPGSGCSTLLKILAGRSAHLRSNASKALNFQGIPSSILHTKLRGEAVYIAETDVHFPELSVRTTLDFAVDMRSGRPMDEDVPIVGQRKGNLVASVGLESAVDVSIGNEVIPGISGGERKRVTIAEALAGLPTLQCWDNSTRGLDSNTALRIMQSVRTASDSKGTTAIVSLYQASQTILDLFDEVTVLYDGHQIYYGTLDSAVAYFERLGFRCPPTATTGDFLTSITNPAESHLLLQQGVSDAPRSAADFATLWRESLERKELLRRIRSFNADNPLGGQEAQALLASCGTSLSDKQFVDCTGDVINLLTEPGRLPFLISISRQIDLCLQRAVRRLRQNIALPISFCLGNAAMALIVGSVFFNLKTDSDSLVSRSILLFFAALLNSFMTGFEVLSIWNQRPIVEKQAAYAFYRSWTEAFSVMVCDLPTKIVTNVLFNVPIYFMTNMNRSASAFFTYLLFALTCMLAMSMIFRSAGSLGRTHYELTVPFGIIVISFITYTGYAVPQPYMHPWLGWIRYINPIFYTFESMMINEFSGRKYPCSRYIPFGMPDMGSVQGQYTCASLGAVAGQSSIDGDHYLRTIFDFHLGHLWRNLGIILAFMVIFSLVHVISSEFVVMKQPKGDVLIFSGRQYKSQMMHRRDEESMLAGKIEAKLPSQAIPSPNQSLVKHTSTVHWENLCYEVRSNGKPKKILDDIEGWIRPGTLTALMGETGAGKTTLLNVLAQRAPGNRLGTLMVDGVSPGQSFPRKIAYVQQEDVHSPTFTVREALQFSALLRQPPHIPRSERLIYVETVIEMLELTSFADALIGTPGDGLNVEQRRRLSIGVEMASRPELLLFLDEPTSGLDSQTAWTICSILRKLADSGQAILCTIHQPSEQLFEMFDRILLIKAGKTLYFGEVGPRATRMISYFEQHGARSWKENENPAEWTLEVTGPCSNVDWQQQWKGSEQRQAVRAEIQALPRSRSSAVGLQSESKGQFAATFVQQLKLLLWRTRTEYWRSPAYIWCRLLFCALSSLIIGFSCWKSPQTIQGLQSQVFAMFLLCTNFSNMMQQIVWTFAGRQYLFEARERHSKTYSWPAFLLASILNDAQWQVLFALISFVLIYFPIGFYVADDPGRHERAVLVFLTFAAFFVFATTFAHLLAAAIDHADTAINIGQLLFYLILIFCGVLVTKDALPRFWIFMYRVSPLSYFIAAVLSAGIANRPIDCSAQEFLSLEPPATATCGSYLADYLNQFPSWLVNPQSSTNCQICLLRFTNDFLFAFDIHFSRMWFYFGVFCVFPLFNMAATFLIYWLVRIRTTASA